MLIGVTEEHGFGTIRQWRVAAWRYPCLDVPVPQYYTVA